jgi:hypothetical protein
LFPEESVHTFPPVLIVPRPVNTFVADESILLSTAVTVVPAPTEIAELTPEDRLHEEIIEVPVPAVVTELSLLYEAFMIPAPDVVTGNPNVVCRILN